MILKLDTHTREESDETIIQTLKRKGWIELVKPEFNLETQTCELINGEWVINDKPPITLEEVWLTGYTDVPSSIRLRATESDQNRYGRLVLLSQLGISKGYISLDTTQSIWDFDGQEHRLSTGDLLSLIVRYGFWCKQMYDLYD
jgi:hypothetical protein